MFSDSAILPLNNTLSLKDPFWSHCVSKQKASISPVTNMDFFFEGCVESFLELEHVRRNSLELKCFVCFFPSSFLFKEYNLKRVPIVNVTKQTYSNSKRFKTKHCPFQGKMIPALPRDGEWAELLYEVVQLIFLSRSNDDLNLGVGSSVCLD